jgi:formate hydrogenlyase transcriptional activator
VSANQVDIAGINNRYAAVAHISEALSLCADVPLDSLTRQRALLDGLLARVPEAIVLLDTDDRILQVNPEFTRLFGYAQEEARERLINELVVPEELLAEAQECRRGLRGESLDLEAVRKHKDGTRVHVSILSAPVSIAGSRICEYVMYRDITKRKRAEQRLRQSEADLRTKNDRLKLFLSVTNQITSNLELREVLRSISSNIRDAMDCDAVFVSLVDPASGTPRLNVLDFPQSKGLIKEEIVYTISGAGKGVLETLKPAVVDVSDPAAVPPEIYDKVVAEGLKSACLIPLVNRGRVLGGLVIARTTETAFTPEDVEFLTQAAGQIAIAIENALTFKGVSELRDKLAQEKLYLEEEIRSEMNFDQIIGNSAALNHVLELVETVAPTDSTVLLLGETGTGKELISRAIHDRSRRKDRTFVKLNCAAIPTGLLESELFGHEKGAFTGAVSQKIGRLELADQGTLFLDEVGDIPIEIQPKLLRALQEREFERLGSIHTRRVNVRLVAATNRDLEKMVADREFRSDLFYRLNVFPIRIPPLRDRRDDIPPLLSYFVQKFARQMQKKIETIPSAVMKELTAWDWPGNIRELENFIERAVILTRGKSLEAPVEELHKADTEEPGRAATPIPQGNIARIVKETVNALNAERSGLADEYANRQCEQIVRALTETRGRIGGDEGAAARLGINRTTLFSRLKRFGIDRRQFAV